MNYRNRKKPASNKSFSPGDLVKIAPWCKNKHRLAHVVEVVWYSDQDVIIQFLDKEGLRDEPSRAVADNLVLLSS
jgi:hypothetical protein